MGEKPGLVSSAIVVSHVISVNCSYGQALRDLAGLGVCLLTSPYRVGLIAARIKQPHKLKSLILGEEIFVRLTDNCFCRKVTIWTLMITCANKLPQFYGYYLDFLSIPSILIISVRISQLKR